MDRGFLWTQSVVDFFGLSLVCPGGLIQLGSLGAPVERWKDRGPEMKIASIDDPIPRGTVFGKRVDGPVDEALHFFKCPLCGGYFDARDRGWVEDHEGPLPHPAQDRAQ
jgi:hypothetical protein